MTAQTKFSEGKSVEMEEFITKLRDQRNRWMQQQEKADTFLYKLLDGCLQLYYLLRADEDYETAFKGFCHFKWNSKTRLTVLICKIVFGEENKAGYAYAKALEAAIAQKIGTTGKVGMMQWLKQSGGINAVIRPRKDEEDNGLGERAFRIEVAKTAVPLTNKIRTEPFSSPFLAQEFSGPFVLLCERDHKNGMINIRFATDKDKYVEDLFALLGHQYMQTKSYKQIRQKIFNALFTEDGDEGSSEDSDEAYQRDSANVVREKLKEIGADVKFSAPNKASLGT